MAISEVELGDRIEYAFDLYSDVQVSPEIARREQADMIANAIAQFVIGRNVTVNGVQIGGGTATGIIIE